MKNDPVNHPNHYTEGCSLECIDVMEVAFGKKRVLTFCLLNAFKYMWRYKLKNGNEDINKAEWYLNKAKTISPSDKTYLNVRALFDKIKSSTVQIESDVAEVKYEAVKDDDPDCLDEGVDKTTKFYPVNNYCRSYRLKDIEKVDGKFNYIYEVNKKIKGEDDKLDTVIITEDYNDVGLEATKYFKPWEYVKPADCTCYDYIGLIPKEYAVYTGLFVRGMVVSIKETNESKKKRKQLTDPKTYSIQVLLDNGYHEYVTVDEDTRIMRYMGVEGR